MSIKVTVRIDEELHDKLTDEYKRFGYRSLNAYVCKLLKHRKVIEVSYGDEVASIIHQIRTCIDNPRISERGRLLCRSYDLLMTEIEKLRNCVESSNTQRDMGI